ncbi:MAG: COX15/CtaA family protein [Gammaproteobacteria bacterium]|nr:COX15/CtaA family protein [Gammaproteobacteria bacterium]
MSVIGSHRADSAIAIWLFCCAGLIFVTVVVGGVTRLTQSGLSMVQWQPVVGVVPPLSRPQWQEAFRKYQQFPEYKSVSRDMTLDQFKFIYLVEYGHRMLGRLIGLVFILPFIYFLMRRRISMQLAPKLLFMFVLGGLQGLLGWYMVQSGLVDKPHVSQYRLVAHLALAVLIYAYIFRTALALIVVKWVKSESTTRLSYFVLVLTLLILLMILSGGFMAGTKAGFVYNTFPRMNGQWVPDELLVLTPLWRNFFENVVTIQFIHRTAAVLVFGITVMIWWWSRRAHLPGAACGAVSLLAMVAVTQITLGVLTLLYQVPVALGVAHQACALALFTIALYVHYLLSPSRRADVGVSAHPEH